MVGGSNNERMLASSSSKGYDFRRNYIAIIEPDNFVALVPNSGGGGPGSLQIQDPQPF